MNRLPKIFFLCVITLTALDAQSGAKPVAGVGSTILTKAELDGLVATESLDSTGGFSWVPVLDSGLFLTGQIRDMASIAYRHEQAVIIFTKNDDQIQVYEITTR